MCVVVSPKFSDLYVQMDAFADLDESFCSLPGDTGSIGDTGSTKYSTRYRCRRVGVAGMFIIILLLVLSTCTDVHHLLSL